MNSLSNLPKLSEAFLAHIEGRGLPRDEWMPCPKCGSREVEVPGGRNMLLGGLLGLGCGGTSGCVAIVVAAVGWFFMLGTAAWILALVILILGLGLGMLFTLSGVLPRISYECKSCGNSWTFQDVEDFQNTPR